MSDDEATAVLNTTPTYDYEIDYSVDYANAVSTCNMSGVASVRSVFLPIIYILVFIIGFMGNALVVYVVVMHRTQRTLIDTCLLNLAISDLIFVLTLPLYAHYLMFNEWTAGDFLCRFSATIHTVGFFSSVFIMVAMAVYRYLLVMHPRMMEQFHTSQVAILLSVVVWFLSLCVSLPVFVYTKMTNELNRTDCQSSMEIRGWRLYYVFSTNILGIVIPLLVMATCYSMIIPRVIRMKSEKRRRTVKLVILIIVVFFLFWIPYDICLFLKFLIFYDEDECNTLQKLSLAVIVTETLAYTHCCLNPIIYAFVAERFMKQALHLLRRVPGIRSLSPRDVSEFSSRKSSLTSQTLDIASTLAS